jgi:transcriptional regulator with XRE-family HTH domain
MRLLIKEKRLARGLTQEGLAAAIGKSGSTVTKYERGYFWPSLPDLEKIAAVLKVPVKELIGDDEPAVIASARN